MPVVRLARPLKHHPPVSSSCITNNRTTIEFQRSSQLNSLNARNINRANRKFLPTGFARSIILETPPVHDTGFQRRQKAERDLKRTKALVENIATGREKVGRNATRPLPATAGSRRLLNLSRGAPRGWRARFSPPPLAAWPPHDRPRGDRPRMRATTSPTVVTRHSSSPSFASVAMPFKKRTDCEQRPRRTFGGAREERESAADTRTHTYGAGTDLRRKLWPQRGR